MFVRHHGHVADIPQTSTLVHQNISWEIELTFHANYVISSGFVRSIILTTSFSHKLSFDWEVKMKTVVIHDNGFLVSKETVVLCRWGRSKQQFGFIKRVDKC